MYIQVEGGEIFVIKIVDYSHEYGSIMQFGKNKSVYIHRWYPFVEGYSKEFISKIVDEYRKLHKGKNIHYLLIFYFSP